jgi:hypothetical protein
MLVPLTVLAVEYVSIWVFLKWYRGRFERLQKLRGKIEKR